MPEWMSLRGYARHRGDALSAVQKAIKDLRVSAAAVKRDTSGKLTAIDREQADRDWALNTDPNEALKNGKWPAGHLPNTERAGAATSAHAQGAESTGMGAASPLTGSPQLELGAGATANEPPSAAPGVGDSQGYLDARTREKQFQAKQAELNYLERVGELVSAAAVRDDQFDIYREHRDKLEQIPANVSDKLAAETDPQRVEHVLRTEIRKTLDELSRALAVDAAAGRVEERAPVTA